MSTINEPENHPLTRNEMKLIRESIAEEMKVISTQANERDKRYEERFKASETAVIAALASQKESVLAAFMASEKAIAKAENAQTAYNERSNEFRQTLDDQAKSLLSRMEATQIFKAQEDKVEDVKTRIGKTEATLNGLSGVITAVEDIRGRINKMEAALAGISSTSIAKEKDVSNTVLYIGMSLSFLFSLVGMLGMIYSFIHR